MRESTERMKVLSEERLDAFRTKQKVDFGGEIGVQEVLTDTHRFPTSEDVMAIYAARQNLLDAARTGSDEKTREAYSIFDWELGRRWGRLMGAALWCLEHGPEADPTFDLGRALEEKYHADSAR